MKEIGILGGGISGLSLAYFLKPSFEILEKNAQCGGLFERFEKDGFTFDKFGCHIFFSKNQQVKNFVKSLFENGEILSVRRKNKIYVKNHFVKYPIENGLAGLDKDDIAGCLIDYINQHILRETKKIKDPENFKEWLIYRFGRHLAELYLIPYNEKIWKTDTEKISLGWLDMVPQPPLETVIKSAIGIETEGGILEQLDALYPKSGGFRTIIDKIESKLNKNHIIKDFKVENIYRKNGVWHVSNGREEREYRKIVSTIPMPELIRCLDAPKEVKTAAENLQSNSLISVLIAVGKECKNDDVKDLTAIYFPEKDFLFNRIGLMKNYSPRNVPDEKSAFAAEITAKQSDKIWSMTDEEISERVVESLQQLGFLRSEDVLFAHVGRTKYAYVIYDFNYKRNIEKIKGFLESTGIMPLGRFGQFEYLLSNACIENAMKIAAHLNKT